MQTIDAALITQFSDMVHVAAQQTKARMRGSVLIKQMKGDLFAYDGLGPIEAQEVVGRIQPTVFSDINHLRRKIARQRFTVTLAIDQSDVRGMLLNPESEYARACARAMDRVFDRICYNALFATVYTGRDFSTSVSAATDGVQTVDATGGLTYTKLLGLSQNFIDAEVGNDVPEKIVLGLTGEEHTALMQETELINKLYTESMPVDKGRIGSVAGMDIVLFGAGANIQQPIITSAAGVRSCFAASTRGLCVGMSKEVGITVEKRPDYVETWQVQLVFELGAVRTEGVLVQKLTTTV